MDCRRPAHYQDLEAIREAAWRLLSQAVEDSRSDCHVLNLATVSQDGSPSIRSVVIRAFDADTRTFRFNVDYRSIKAREILSRPLVAAHVYAKNEKVQLRMLCRATINQADAASNAAWRSMQAMSRRCYGQVQAPGAPLDAPETVAIEPATQIELAPATFATVTAEIQTLDWLYLAAAGHRRAFFDWRSGAEARSWLAP